MVSTTILIADDRALARSGARHALTTAVAAALVVESNTLQEALAMVAQHRPPIALLAAHLPDDDAGDGCAALQAVNPNTAVVLLAEDDSDAQLVRAHEAGAAGYLARDTGPTELVAVVEDLLSGRTAFTVDHLARIHAWRQEVAARVQLLTNRELEVLHRLADGATNSEIAETLAIAVNTVECHVRRIYPKLRLGSRREVMRGSAPRAPWSAGRGNGLRAQNRGAK